MKIFGFFLIIFFTFTAHAQNVQRNFELKQGGTVEIINLFGRVDVSAEEADKEENAEESETNAAGKVFVSAISNKQIAESNIKIDNSGGRVKIEIVPTDAKTRVDLTVKIPPRSRVKIKTSAGEVRVAGNLESAEVVTETGTIAANVPLENLKYDFIWTESRPRFLSDVELEEVKEKAAGKFVVNGKIVSEGEEKETEDNSRSGEEVTDSEQKTEEENGETTNKKSKKKKREQKINDKGQIKLNFTTARGIVLLNVNPNEVPSNLRERPLTEAARAIIRSGDSLLTEAIRRASPKYFGDYARTLPPRKREPILNTKTDENLNPQAIVKKATIRVSDLNNRAIADLQKKDFEVFEAGEKREILSVEPTTAPFNLVLLLDVSGSVDNYVDFIRKAARNFVNTVSRNDRIAIIIFNEDVKTLSTFTTNKGKLSETLDTFDAGGGTAFYDAIAYTLVETLKPLKGERTAIVALSDGDDNRSFLSFESLLGSIQESGALVYPLYVPSGLIAASAANNYNSSVDPLRTRFMALTTKAEAEGEKLAQVSGGVYYSIKQLSELQKAYDDIVLQLRTAYTITFRSNVAETRDNRASPRLRIKVNRENTFVKIGSVVEVSGKETSGLKKNNFPQRPLNTQREEQFNQTDFKLNFNHLVLSAGDLNFVKTNLDSDKQISFANFATLRETFFQSASFSLPQQIAEISGEVEKIKYKQFVNDNLRETKLENFDINKTSGAFVLNDGKQKIAVSRWISPKRTRSYPYERVYDTLAFPKRVTIIPVLKDEGLGGERDFLQWDTISLLSLLDVRVVLAYYSEATKNTKRADQITAQKLDNNYVLARLNEVFDFKGTAREWNEREAKELKSIFEKAKLSYAKISRNTKTYLHDETALNELIKYTETPQRFIEFSRRKSQNAQNREFQTLQPKEALSTDTKGKVTITNALFGKYFFTVDEMRLEPKTVYLIESKHSQRIKLPSENDIKDGLVKMMLYTNLQNVKVGAKPFDYKVMIRLTSNKLNGSITSNIGDEDLVKFCSNNLIDFSQREFLKKLFQEARENKFTIILERAETAK